MNTLTLTTRVMVAFADAPWPHSSPEEEIKPDNALQIVDELFLVSNATKKFELPRLMCLAVTVDDVDLAESLIRGLVEFLDVDFDDPEQTNDLLKKAKVECFINYSESQSNSIWQWLKYVQTKPDSIDFNDLLTSAIDYWQKRAGLSPHASNE